MKVDTEKKGQGKIALTVEVSVEEAAPYLDRAALRLAHKHQMPGFRPGKAPMSLIKSKIGDMALYEEALQELVTKTMVKALAEKKINSVGHPELNVSKVAPGNPIVYTAIVSVMPEINLGNWRSVQIGKKLITITEDEVDAMLDQLRNMQAKEVAVDRAANKSDKVELNFEVKQNGVIIEGGKALKYPVILGKGAMVPGFEEKLIGMKAKDKKEFDLKFPKPYFQEKLAGTEAHYSVELMAVYERTLPAKDDEWAKAVMGKTYKELIEELRDNLKKEKEAKERHRIEKEMFDKIIDQASFSDIPEILLKSEAVKMVSELEHDVTHRGMKWEQYLNSIKKTKEELEKEFGSQADKRVKSALALRHLADELGIDVSDQEVDGDLVKQRERYKDDANAREQLSRPEYKSYLKRILINRKTIDNLVSLLAEDKNVKV